MLRGVFVAGTAIVLFLVAGPAAVTGAALPQFAASSAIAPVAAGNVSVRSQYAAVVYNKTFCTKYGKRDYFRKEQARRPPMLYTFPGRSGIHSRMMQYLLFSPLQLRTHPTCLCAAVTPG